MCTASQLNMHYPLLTLSMPRPCVQHDFGSSLAYSSNVSFVSETCTERGFAAGICFKYDNGNIPQAPNCLPGQDPGSGDCNGQINTAYVKLDVDIIRHDEICTPDYIADGKCVRSLISALGDMYTK